MELFFRWIAWGARAIPRSLLILLPACALVGCGTPSLGPGDSRVSESPGIDEHGEGSPDAGTSVEGADRSLEGETESYSWRDLMLDPGLDSFARTSFGGEGEITAEEGGWVFDFGHPLTGIHLRDLPEGAAMREGAYEVECHVERLVGNDFFCGLTVPVGQGHATVILGGWGGALCGLSCLDGMDAARNETRSFRSFLSGQVYRLRVRVEPGEVRATLDGEPLFRVPRGGRSFEVRPEVAPSRPLGFACFQTEVRLHALRWRPCPPEVDRGTPNLPPSPRR